MEHARASSFPHVAVAFDLYKAFGPAKRVLTAALLSAAGFPKQLLVPCMARVEQRESSGSLWAR
eukprot:5174859-Alexandrium_andersonii.AAC.1